VLSTGIIYSSDPLGVDEASFASREYRNFQSVKNSSPGYKIILNGRIRSRRAISTSQGDIVRRTNTRLARWQSIPEGKLSLLKAETRSSDKQLPSWPRLELNPGCGEKKMTPSNKGKKHGR
jgi:hypothetical protein